MRQITLGLALSLSLLFGLEVKAAIMFDTLSTARQTISSPLYSSIGGSIVIVSHGSQHFTVDPVAGTANVTSAFTGNDLLTPAGYASYDLYNTVTTGTSSQNGDGTYNISFSLLFELKVTSGPLSGLTFETKTNSIFAASNIATLPFPIGTVFSDPSSTDITNVYVKFDPTSNFPTGFLFGTSSGRTVTINAVVPEPSSLMTIGVGVIAALGYSRRRRAWNCTL